MLVSPIIFIAASFIVFVTQVSAHGFLAVPKPRGYSQISYAIDNLRNPTTSGNMCRGQSSDGTVSTLTLSDGGTVTFKLALSIGAEHIGTCSVVLYDSTGSKSITLVSGADGCASDQGSHPKTPGASAQCPGLVPTGLVTDDMCLKTWSFKLPSKITGLDFTSGFVRWSWIAKHVTPFEYYENCADVNIVYKGTATTATTTSSAASATTTSTNSNTTKNATTTTTKNITTTKTKTTSKATSTPTNCRRKKSGVCK